MHANEVASCKNGKGAKDPDDLDPSFDFQVCQDLVDHYEIDKTVNNEREDV